MQRVCFEYHDHNFLISLRAIAKFSFCYKIIKFIIIYLLAISYNQPKLTVCEVWDLNAITFANESLISQQPTGIFINTNNTIYLADHHNGRIVEWQHGSAMPTRNISGKSLINSWNIFVNKEGDINADNGEFNIQKHKWTWNDTYTECVMNNNESCTGLFIDIKNNFYCSLVNNHRVDKINLNNDIIRSITVAGTGYRGPLSNMLDHPHGIFVNMNLDLYVADTYNNRI